MKENKKCQIIQDLLPNYVENLTKPETNQLIEEHLKECPKCKEELIAMKNAIEVDRPERNKKEIKYIKKFSNKLRILKLTLLGVILLFTIIIGRRIIIISKLSNTAKEYTSQEHINYHLKTEIYSEGNMQILEAYYKGETSILIQNNYSKNTGIVKQIHYHSNTEKFSIIDNGKEKLLREGTDFLFSPLAFKRNGFIEYLSLALSTDVRKTSLAGKECYLIKDEDIELFIEAHTGLIIKTINNSKNITTDYYCEFNTVTDNEINRPDTSFKSIS